MDLITIAEVTGKNMLSGVVDDTPIQTGKVVPDEPLELDFQVVQAFPSL